MPTLTKALFADAQELLIKTRGREPFKGYVEIDQPSPDLMLLAQRQDAALVLRHKQSLLAATFHALSNRIEREKLNKNRPASMIAVEFDFNNQSWQAGIVSEQSRTYIGWHVNTGMPTRYYALCQDEHHDDRWAAAQSLLSR